VLAFLAEAYNYCQSAMDSQGCPWAPCVSNKGFTPLSFTSLMTGVNIALSKWGAFRNSLLEVEQQFEEIKDKTLSERKEHAALFASDLGSKELQLLPSMVKNDLIKIRKKNARRWERARICANWMAWLGGVTLFFNISLGVLGIAFLIPWAITHISAKKSFKKIEEVVESNVSALENRLMAQREQQGSLEQEINQALQ